MDGYPLQAMNERRKHLEFLRKTASEAIWSGDYERALTLYDDGLGARPLLEGPRPRRPLHLQPRDDPDRDGPAATSISSRLKEIVLRNPSSFNGVLAAYVSANAHEARGEYARARFYAQTALAKSRELGLEELTGTSLNLLANLELHESRFEVGARSLRRGGRAPRVGGREPLAPGRRRRGQPRLLPHRARRHRPRACRSCERSLSVLESLGARQAMDYPSLDLCFAHVKLNRLDEAESWGLRALALGKEFGREDVVKNSHYLLAETYSELGRESEADDAVRRARRATTRTSRR